MDHHVLRAITAHEDGSAEFGDLDLLDRAEELRRVLFTQDDDLLAEAVASLGEPEDMIG